MTEKQVYKAIERNKCCIVQVNDSAGKTVCVIESATAEGVVSQMEEYLPDFRGYKRLQINGVEKKGTPWTKGYSWLLEFDKTEEGQTKTTAIGAIPNGAISPLEYVSMFKEMMTENMKGQKELMEATLKLNNQDPAKWIPVFQAVAPALGLTVNQGSIAGPPSPAPAVGGRNELHFVDDIDTSKITPDDLTNIIGQKLNTLSTQISGPQMLRLISALEKNKNLKDYADKISKLLIAVAGNPAILDVAIAQLNIK